VQKFHNIILPKLNSSLHDSVSSRRESVSSRHSVDSIEKEGLEPCAICLEHYEEGDQICWSHNRHCDHVFHQECIVEWLGLHNECPICRQDFLSLEDLDDESNHAQHPESEEQSPVQETEESPVDELLRLSWIRSLFQRQRIVQPSHHVELKRPELNGASMHRWSSSHHEESTVSIEVVTV
jgi:Ring finger domain